MSFSYSGDPQDSDLDAVRFYLQDTASPGLLADEEISFLITKFTDTYSDPMMVAAFCADIVAGKYAGEISISADGVTYSGEQLQDKYKALAAQLRSSYEQMQSVGATPFAGGSLITDAVPQGDVIPLNFGIGQHDNQRAGLQRYGYLGDITLPDYEPELDPANYEP